MVGAKGGLKNILLSFRSALLYELPMREKSGKSFRKEITYITSTMYDFCFDILDIELVGKVIKDMEDRKNAANNDSSTSEAW